VGLINGAAGKEIQGDPSQTPSGSHNCGPWQSSQVADVQYLIQKIIICLAVLRFFLSSLVKLLITNNAFLIVQRATAQSKQGIFVIVV
jgi:hypothetical protein